VLANTGHLLALCYFCLFRDTQAEKDAFLIFLLKFHKPKDPCNTTNITYLVSCQTRAAHQAPFQPLFRLSFTK